MVEPSSIPLGVFCTVSLSISAFYLSVCLITKADTSTNLKRKHFWMSPAQLSPQQLLNNIPELILILPNISYAAGFQSIAGHIYMKH